MLLHFIFDPFPTTAEFDNEVLQQEQNHMAHLETNLQHMANELHYLRNAYSRPNLNLPQQPSFSGLPSELHTFKLRLCQFLKGNHNTYTNFESQLRYADSLLARTAGQWYESLVDPITPQLPPTYTLEVFLNKLDDFEV